MADMHNPGGADTDGDDPTWLKWARELHSIGQNGLLYARDEYDRERYNRVLEIAAEVMAEQSRAEDYPKIRQLFDLEQGYLTPKIDVRAIVMRDGKMLMVRELADEGRWTLPGGWAEPNDSPSAAIEREVAEETGYRVKARQVLAVYNRSSPRHGHHPPTPLYVYKLFFLCDLVGGEPAASLETGESQFFGRDSIPEDLSIARVTRTQLLRFFEKLENNDISTDFD